MKEVRAAPDATLTLTSEGRSTTVSLYSDEGMALVNALRLKQAAEFKVMYEPRWLGQRIIQLPEDIVALQELLWDLKPDVVIECGIAHGGSLVLHASILELIGHGSVIGIDVEIRPHNRAAIEAHPLSHRIGLIEGSSIDPTTVAAAKARCADAGRVMVILDSNHTTAHVAKEILLYRDIVTPGSYLIVMDGAQALVADIPRGKPEWADDNPLIAIRDVLAKDPEFERDDRFVRFGPTSAPEGFWRKRERALLR